MVLIIFFLLAISGIYNDVDIENALTSGTLFGNTVASAIIILLSLMIIAILFFVGAWSQAALIMKLIHPEVGVKKSYQLAWPRMPAIFGASILAGLAIIGGMTLFFIPGIIVAVWIFFTVPVCLLEDRRGFAALLRSKQIVEGYWWDIVARAIGLWAVLAGIGIVINLVTFGLGAFLLNLFFTPFATIFVMLLYYNLHEIKSKELESESTKGKNIFLGFVILSGILIFFMLLAPLFAIL
ncbi:MAG: hypothetical protein A3B74_02385 [Candidatus Kerfeldbacteria bacterium RIFCSPHIGHO2_02_FULL_42_14]|uniref:Glycerophosphoryl diester phosphodiesterase membrane domain-containing protein n=1 Tax=Candidatus Kerfeldbacteria bacterium RIFCSPHIGHO2_02_FULL_42_14 TaxID=1798540 RepID=A0A1G2AST6_9BACT|nr:MAG: hypothetical protein A3B74_02385 [Candidatus Kerfeldbacteria bacterium RIFCSPHIGHO2_02_FULL_42_14]OGY80393.1 MAG: hypothetical protein A3E60_05005 [Candidatus Kerfeldbacteria bacterium RIFCSPHIGHO2_12_FULL_42_13]OGY83822.1 MAG: hypothetical protein A3I91_04530 [Candidatus Kerfeldbacteria bacterium RIFCSPLOWO2_02_FULL_42_19]OGY85404.1 MAG: hypothetical protein A3G01_02335 [Candidatus Kerfeldbacteria bacterium RIFCSPLOWO2_12_FULL_43_9]